MGFRGGRQEHLDHCGCRIEKWRFWGSVLLSSRGNKSEEVFIFYFSSSLFRLAATQKEKREKKKRKSFTARYMYPFTSVDMTDSVDPAPHSIDFSGSRVRRSNFQRISVNIKYFTISCICARKQYVNFRSHMNLLVSSVVYRSFSPILLCHNAPRIVKSVHQGAVSIGTASWLRFCDVLQVGQRGHAVPYFPCVSP